MCIKSICRYTQVCREGTYTPRHAMLKYIGSLRFEVPYKYMNIYIYIYICMYSRVYKHIHVYMFIYIYTYIYGVLYVYMCTCKCAGCGPTHRVP